jgi:DNA polymerase-1
MLRNNTFEKTAVLVDGNSIMHRAFHGLGKHFAPTHNGEPVGMIYGFASILLNAIEHFRPEILIATFDTKEKTFRHEIDPEYKANRSTTPEEFYTQIPMVFDFLDHCGIPMLKQPGFESDDLIGTLATITPTQFAVKILSSDMDFTQLLTEQVSLVKLMTQVKDAPEYGPAETFARYGVTPAQMVDFKAITGDSSDNYKGITGVGAKTAQKLMTEFLSLDGIYQNLDAIASDKVRQKFIDQKEYAYHCQYLAQIKLDVPLAADFTNEFVFDFERARQFLQQFNFRALDGRLQRLQRRWEQPVKAKKIAQDDTQMALF